MCFFFKKKDGTMEAAVHIVMDSDKKEDLEDRTKKSSRFNTNRCYQVL